ncbi:hypothetical protein FHG87_000261 [Trinorchestia longiramus]|nr:hypothetical protein FHG87_000261 [Trinorchestia longiramus]
MCRTLLDELGGELCSPQGRLRLIHLLSLRLMLRLQHCDSSAYFLSKLVARPEDESREEDESEEDESEEDESEEDESEEDESEEDESEEDENNDSVTSFAGFVMHPPNSIFI